MAPTSTAVTGFLRQIVHYHLDNNSYENALFFAERLTAHDPRSSESAHLLSLCHLRLGDTRSAYEVSKPAGYRGINLGCAWVFAQACLALERYKDGISALEKARGLWTQKSNIGKHSATSRATYPDAAAVLCLLGKLYRAYDDRKKAVGCFEDALKANPFMWDAFTAMCDVGAALRVPNIFKMNDQLLQNFEQEHLAASIAERESALFGSLDPTVKKTLGRTVGLESENPFELHRSPTYQDMPFGSNVFSAETEENEFLTKINAAARSRFGTANATSQLSDGMETPTAPAVASAIISQIPPSVFHPEPPQAPIRNKRAAPGAEAGYLDVPPKMSYRLGSRKPAKAPEKDQEQATEAAPEVPTTTLRSAIPSLDRKRTASGHPIMRTAAQDDAMPRRSTRINMFKSSKPNSGAATIGAAASRELKKARPQISRLMRPGSSGSSVGRVVSGNRKPPPEENGLDVDHGETARIRPVAAQPPQPPQAAAPPAPTKPAEPDTAKVEEALKSILDLLKKMAIGYYSASQFRCQDALQAYMSVPRAQQDTPWVLAQMGRAHYEQAAYAEAEKFFRRVRILAPTRLDDMEVYSTILWFLKRETDLSFLAHELVDAAWHSPQAWCALGNAWSLARDHEQALRCFRRATQLDPRFAYAFTLQGHEHVANEEYEKALTAYRSALATDKRHYNAFYGIGRVYERLGNYDKAQAHFGVAAQINPTNAVLVCCIGTVLEKQKHMTQALHYFSRATDLAPRAAQTRYKKARALLAVGQLEAAHRELMILKDLAPDEATVHFLLGKLYRGLNEKQMAVRHFSNALALDPKVSAF